MRVVTVWNPKGGAGKTSLTYHLAGALARGYGKRVLVVDGDTQPSVSKLLIGDAERVSLHPSATIVAVFEGAVINPREVIRPTRVDGIDLVPGHKGVHGDYCDRPWDAPDDVQGALASFFGILPAEWDVVILDTPPNRSVCPWAGLLGSDALIVPVDPDPLGVSTVGEVEAVVAEIPAEQSAVEHLGFVMTRAKTKAIYQVFLDGFREEHGDRVFPVVMPESDMFAKAIAHQQVIADFSRRSKGSKCVNAIAGELLARLERLDASRKGAA